LAGSHDFSAFRATGGADTSPICRVDSVGWAEWEGGLRLDIEADHFLYHMVRNILGTALDAAAEADPTAAMRAVLESRDRRKAGVTAPPHGLCLERVCFEEPAS
jgi:tRNA pseudouridine38-40 synthase